MVTITSPDDPRIELYRHLHGTPQSHTDAGILIAEGTKTTSALLKSKIEIVSIFAMQEFYDEYSELIGNRNLAEHQLFTAGKSVMNEIVGFRLHEGIMAIGIQPPSVLIEKINFPAVALCGIVNSENVGSIIRNCAAFGVRSVIVDKATSSPYLRRAVRVSVGAVFSMQILFVDDMVSALLHLRMECGATIISSEITDNSVDIDEFIFPKKSVILFGSEGKGIDNAILAESDTTIYIPIQPEVNSLNVAAASAVILRELWKSMS